MTGHGMTSDRRAVQRTDYTYPSIACCEGADRWWHEDVSDAALRRAARNHVAETGHVVHIDWARATVYKPDEKESAS